MMADMNADKEKPTFRRVRAGEEVAGKLGHLLAPGTSAQNAGARTANLRGCRRARRSQRAGEC
jgi:hypothetical protein